MKNFLYNCALVFMVLMIFLLSMSSCLSESIFALQGSDSMDSAAYDQKTMGDTTEEHVENTLETGMKPPICVGYRELCIFNDEQYTTATSRRYHKQ